MPLNVIYEKDNCIVINKPAGLPTQTARPGQRDVISEVCNYLSLKGIHSPEVHVINRLDQPVEGLVLLAYDKVSAANLSKQLIDNKIQKYYEARVFGHLPNKSGRLEDMLIKDNKTNMSKVALSSDKQAKKAILEYEVVDSDEDTDTIRIHLITGRHHQIRVQFSHAGCPLLGDSKYGNAESMAYAREHDVRNVALKAYSMSFVNPTTGEKTVVTV